MQALPAIALSDSQDDGLTVKPTSIRGTILVLLKDMGILLPSRHLGCQSSSVETLLCLNIFNISLFKSNFSKYNIKDNTPKLYLHFFINNSCHVVNMELELKLKSDMKLFGSFILSERMKLGIGKNKFGQLCGGLSETYIRNVEEGNANISLKSLTKLKSGMNSTIPTIITRNKKTFSNKTIKLARSENVDTAKKNFSNRLLAIMKKRRLSSIEFSNYLGMDESATNKYLNGSENPTYLMLLRFAYVLDVEVVDFFDYAGVLPDNSKYKLRYLNP